MWDLCASLLARLTKCDLDFYNESFFDSTSRFIDRDKVFRNNWLKDEALDFFLILFKIFFIKSQVFTAENKPCSTLKAQNITQLSLHMPSLQRLILFTVWVNSLQFWKFCCSVDVIKNDPLTHLLGAEFSMSQICSEPSLPSKARHVNFNSLSSWTLRPILCFSFR